MPLSRPQIFDALSIATIVAAIAVVAWRGTPVAPASFDLPTTQGVANASVQPIGDSTRSSNAFGDSTAVVNANIFSASRRAPRVRFVSPDAFVPDPTPAFSPATEMTADSSMRDSSVAANTDSVPRLYGIVSQDGVRRALLRLSRQNPSPQLFVEGDRHSGWQVTRIEADRVTVRGPAGQRVLRLVTSQPSDSSGKRI